MVLGFQDQFEKPVRDGTKRHTIRALSNREWRPGIVCDCFVRPRQKGMRLIGRWPCVKVEQIRIFTTDETTVLGQQFHIVIEGIKLSPDEAAAFAWRDGFRSHGEDGALDLMQRFWMKTHGKGVAGRRNGRQYLPRYVDFTGIVIHWDYDKPCGTPKERKTR